MDRSSANRERRIVRQISQMLSPERKAHFVRLLHEMWVQANSPGPGKFVLPVDYKPSGGGRRTHKYAIDLFAPEGVPDGHVRAVDYRRLRSLLREWAMRP